MKITESFLRKIIKEGIEDLEAEAEADAMASKNMSPRLRDLKAAQKLFKFAETGGFTAVQRDTAIQAYKAIQSGTPLPPNAEEVIKSMGGTLPASSQAPAAPTTPAAQSTATVAAPTAQPAPAAKPALAPNSKVKTKSGKSFTFIRSQGNVAYITDGSSEYKVNLASLTPELQESKVFKTSYIQKIIKEETQKYLQEMKIKI